MKKVVIVFFSLIASGLCFGSSISNLYIVRSDRTLVQIYKFYQADVGNHLLNETYPVNPKSIVSYVINQDTTTKKRVAYLWPTSAVLSGVVALIENTNEKRYKTILDTDVLPGLEHYYDISRQPACYQSYLNSDGKQDRYYDDNVWLDIDFASLFLETKEKKYLSKAEEIWKFVISGWDDKLGGGIYWCEQKKSSKNTCSNAPAAVAAAKLYEATKNKEYLQWSKKIYAWTKLNLQDKSDLLYYDNINLNGLIGKQKFAYNSGQMLQAAVLLYNITKEKEYLTDARSIASAGYNFFFETHLGANGKSIKLVKQGNIWFTAIMLRGYIELYLVDKNKTYLNAFKYSLDLAWKNSRDKNGLFEDDWTGKEKNSSKWLLAQGAMVEMYARLSAIK
ncbi:MAG: glycoside hydrolase family 76 protein [Paludibacter sp.]|nr:glycoside hydrolase family 76 protein [Paludibacter sp.]